MKHTILPENWDTLPVEDVLMGGTKKKIKYDKASNTVYMLNDRGEWTGEKTHPPVRKQAAPIKENAGDPNNPASNENNEEPVVLRRPKKKKIGMNAFLTIIIIILVAVLVIQNMPLNGGPRTYDIIVAMENINPGDKVSGKLSKKTVTAAEYQQMAVSGGLYMANDYDAIKSYYATEFIPKDGVVTYSNVGEDFTAKNPWTSEGAKYTILLPISLTTDKLEEFMWGNKLTITVKATREIDKTENPEAYRPSSPEVSGETTIIKYQTDTYVLTDFTIIDVMNANKKTLYSAYAGMAAIPDLYREDCIKTRYKSKAQMEVDMPAYIKISVSKETLDWWDVVTSKKHDISVSLKVTGFDGETGDGEYTYKSEVNNTMRKMAATIKAAWTLLEED